MFQRARPDATAAAQQQQRMRHVARNNEAAVESQLNQRVDAEIEQLLTSFGEIIQSSRIHNSSAIDLSGKASAPRASRPSAAQPKRSSALDSANQSDGENDADGYVPQSAGGRQESTKDKYAVAQEAYGAQTRAATMVRSVEKLLAMVADVRRARLVNDSAALAAMADARRRALEERTLRTRQAVEALNAAVDAAVRDLETVYYNTKYAK
ncbi:hypothetical protein GGI07_005710 [Coemansia sp. Benny D115]|nr:hypothetical protein GGI07_005710 [Coemansia sp. Benny D115]